MDSSPTLSARRFTHLIAALGRVLLIGIMTCHVAVPAIAGVDSVGDDRFVGLWKATRRFGPDARGPLVIQRTGDVYFAEMMAHRVPVRLADGELSFELPADQGAWRGKMEPGDTLMGHWYPPRSFAMGGHTTPVKLRPDGPNRWSGEIVPFDDVFTYFLLIQKRQDGSLSALLRNPERDFGAWLGVERLVHDGDIVKLMGKRRGQKEEREITRGTYDSENGVISLAFPSRGGTYDFARDGDESDFYPRGKIPGRYAYRPPPARDDGWPIGSLEEVGIDRVAVESFIQSITEMSMDSVDAPQIHAVLIARHGKLVLEEYFHGEHRDKLHETRSAAKSVTAIIVGAAIKDGLPLELSSPVYEVMNDGAFPANLDPRKRAMTLEHLLTMSSGFFCDDNNPDAPGNEDKMWDLPDEPDFYLYSLDVPMATAPGENAVYCSMNPNLALGMVGRATGESPLYVFDRLVAAPMNIKQYGWQSDPAGNPYGGGGVQFRSRDFMKFGQLMLNDGIWKGHKILDRDFVRRATSPLYQIGDRGYGYLWWCTEYPYRDRTVHSFAALGAGGQSVTVVPELDLVIACFAGSYSSRGWRWFPEAIPKFILPAVEDTGSE